MLNKDEVATLESLIRRMTWKQRAGLDAWLASGGNDGSLWEAAKEAQEYVHWFEVSPGEPCRPTPRLKVVK
jgi:hypothetical protein